MRTNETYYDETSTDATDEQIATLRRLGAKEDDLRELTSEGAEELIQSLQAMRDAATLSAKAG